MKNMPVDIKKKAKTQKLGENTQQKHLNLFSSCKKPLLKEDRECDALGFCLSLSLIISVMATILRHSFRLSLCDSKYCEIALINKLH